MLTPVLPRAAPLADFHAAFADFLRVDVANGDASPDTLRNYRNEVALWVGWCAAQSFDPATVTPRHIKRYRQALLEAGYKPITIRWKLTIVRRFYEAARNAGLRTDNPAAGVRSPRVRQATEDFKYLCDEELARLLDAIPDPEQAIGREKVRRLRNLLMVSMMALQALRTIEVHRSNVEDLLEKGEQLTLLVRGKTRDRIAYLRPDMGRRLKEYLALARTQPRHLAPQPKAPVITPRIGVDGVLDSFLFAQHAIEMFRRSLPEGPSRNCLDRLSNRLTKILAEARKLTPPG
jgi:integrase/recombinase XerD